MKTRRYFLKLAVTLPFIGPIIARALPAIKPPRQYLSSCPCDQVIGLCFVWDEDHIDKPNPCPGSDWIVTSECDQWETFLGVEFNNYRRNKFWCKPVIGNGHRQVLCLVNAERHDGSIDYSRFELPALFYRP